MTVKAMAVEGGGQAAQALSEVMTPERRRRKPKMPDNLRPFVQQARARTIKRPNSPGVAVEETGGGGHRLAAPHCDEEAWEVQICDAFGTRSHSTYRVFLSQLAGLCERRPSPDGHWRPSERELNAAVNIVSGVRPQNEVEAALAAQMVAVHFMQMKTSAEAMRSGCQDERLISIAGKLARTYAIQCESMTKLKGKVARQRITVRYERHDHQHVHVEGPGGGDSGGQPDGLTDDAAAREHARRPALPSPDSAWDTVPGNGGEREGALSLPRRGARGRRAKG